MSDPFLLLHFQHTTYDISALALSSQPRVLLLDEATSGLENKTEKLVEKSIVDYVKVNGASVLWVTHSEDLSSRLLAEDEL